MFINNIKQHSAIFELIPKPFYSDNVQNFKEIKYYDENKMLELEIILENIEKCKNEKIIQYSSVDNDDLSVLTKLSNYTYTKLDLDMGGNVYFNSAISVNELLNFVKDIIFSNKKSIEENSYEDKSVNILGNNNQVASGYNISQSIEVNSENVFEIMRELVKSNDDLSDELISVINRLEGSKNTEEYKSKYVEFMKIIAPFISLFSNFIPIISQFL